MQVTALNILPPSGVTEAINTMRGTGISLYVHGGPGISKSAVALQVANACGIAFIDFRLSQVAPEDIRGVPVPGEVDRMKGIIWTPPLVFPRDLDYEFVDDIASSGVGSFRFFNPIGNNGIHYCTDPDIQVDVITPGLHATVEKRLNVLRVALTDDAGHPAAGTILWRVTGKARAILALEEFNSAALGVMAAAYQLILDRRIGDYVVPNEVMLLAMGNRDSDRGVTYQLVKPVANRFIHVEMVFDWNDWFAWAGGHGIHSEVLGFLSKWPSKAYDFDPDSPHHSFATPRSWEFVSKVISHHPQPSRGVMLALICGAVGDAIGNEFVQHREYMAGMPDVAGILDGSITTFTTAHPTHAMQISYNVCVELCYTLKNRMIEVERSYPGSPKDREYNKYPPRQRWLEQADRAMGYAIDNFRPDVTVMMTRLATVVLNLKFAPALMPRFRAFMETHRELILP